jgi:ABC-2 type transport system permease protein
MPIDHYQSAIEIRGLTKNFGAVLVGFVAVYLLGSLSRFPQWLLDLEPFAHVPLVGGDGFAAAPLLWLLVIDAALTALGVAAFRRRDLRS